MNQALPSGESAPTFTLQLGSRTIVIDNSQWMGFPFVPFPARKLGKPNDRCLVIRCSAWWKILTATMAVLTILLLAGEILWQQKPLSTVGSDALTGILLTWCGWGFMGEARFDHGAGAFIHGPPGWRRRRPLADILAVQLFHHRARWGASRYQLFLILDDARRPRRLLLHVRVKKRNLTWVRQVAGEVAEFLGVPLVDQISAP